MSTRWFVEVSPVEADTLKERYCVAALQWQQALQQARKLRADRGPLSRFAIELLDVGYRATDPSARLRYTVSKAPEDAPLSGNATAQPAAATALAAVAAVPAAPAAEASPLLRPGAHPAGTSPARPSQIPLPRAHEARGRAASLPAAASVAAGPSIAPVIPRRGRDESPVAEPLSPAPATPPEEAATWEPPAVTDRAAVPIELVASKPSASTAAAVPAPAPADVPPPSEAPAPAASPVDEPVPSLPGLELLSQRREEPREGNPIAYREYAFCVAPGLTPREVERYVRAIWEQVRTALAGRPQGKLVQIALFDHRFAGKPERPPIGALAWKDWRGDPHLQIQGMPQSEPQESLVPKAPGSPPPTASVAPAPSATATPLAGPPPPPPPSAVIPVDASSGKEEPEKEEPEKEEPEEEAPVSSEGPALVVQEMSAEEALELGIGPSSMSEPPRSAALSDAPQPQPPPAPEAAVPPPAPEAEELPRPPAPAPRIVLPPADAPSAAPSVRRGSLAPVPAGMRRRGPGEDLIGDLFEQMHQLVFMPDLAAGAEYVLHTLLRIVPSEGALVHVFDINARQFVVVRAAGANAGELLLHRTPDTFPLFRDAFRRSRTMIHREIPDDDRYRGGRFQALGVHVKLALCGPVHQGGRYLGVLELVNPLGGTAFHEAEVNAVDYICEQFAAFVASRPVVLDADAVVPKA